MKVGKRNSRQGTTGRRLLSVFFSLVLVLGLIPAMTFATAKEAQATEGSGSADDPYIIGTSADLQQLATGVNDGTISTAGKHYRLGADIDLADINPWTSIGTETYPFAGTFDGDGHTISGLKLDGRSNRWGLFGYNSGTVTNFTIDGAEWETYVNGGGLAVYNNAASGVVSNIKATGFTIYIGNNSEVGTGGIVGTNDGLVDYCVSDGTINVRSGLQSRWRTGGVVGENHNAVRNCANYTEINGNAGMSDVGGIVGRNDDVTRNTDPQAYIENCYNWAALSGRQDVGGIAGYNWSSQASPAVAYIRNCYNTAKMSTTENQVYYSGSIAGVNAYLGHIEDCFSVYGGADNPSENYAFQGKAWNGAQNNNRTVHNDETALQDLCDKLNAWVDQQSDSSIYKRWSYDPTKAPYPVFEEIVTVTFQAGDHGNFGLEDDKPITEVQQNTAGGAAWNNSWVPATITPEDGYEFDGWDKEFPDTVSENITFVAQWKAKTDTPYKVQFFYQTNGTYSDTPDSTDNRTGTTDTTATVTDADKMPDPAKTGYVLDTSKDSDWSGTIAGDGSLKLKVYFKQQFTVIYDPGTQGTWDVKDDTHSGLSYGANTPSPNAAPLTQHNPGYTFIKWDPERAATVTGDVTYTAQWTPNTNTAYTVEFYYQTASGTYLDTPTSKDTSRKGMTDNTASVTDADKTPDPTQSGYALDSLKNEAWSGTIAGDGSLVLKVYFKKQFTVTYSPGAQGTWDAKDDTHSGQDYGVNTPDSIHDPSADESHNPGYTFTGWAPAKADTVTANVDYVAQWAAKEDTKYTVEYYYQEGGAYSDTATSSREGAGTTDTTATVTDADKQPTEDGYILDESKADAWSGPIAGDGSLVLKVYFKQQFTVTYYPGNHGTWDANNDKHENLDYGAAIPAPNSDTATAHDAGYTFAGWSPEASGTVTANLDYVAEWTANTDTPYTVEFYYQENGEYKEVADSTDERAGTTDTTAELSEADKTPTEDGYALDGEAPNVLSGNIDGDGSLVLKVYFKQQFTIVYDPGEHGSWAAADETTAVGYEDATPSPSIDPELAHDAGYEFAGWDPEVADKVTADATYTALWKPAEDTAYTVEFYDMSDDGTYPAEPTAKDTRTGTTDTTASVTDEDKTSWDDRYVLDESKAEAWSGTIAGDGSLVLKVYFKLASEPEPEPGPEPGPDPEPEPGPEPKPEPEPAPVTPTTYSLTYNLNGGSYKGSTGSIVETHEEGSVVKIHEAPIREGYTFLYWKGSEYQPGDSYTVTGDHTFTAQWEKKAIEPTPVTPSDKNGGKTSPGKKSDTAPKTGDESRTGLLAIMLLAASLSLFMADRSRRRRAK